MTTKRKPRALYLLPAQPYPPVNGDKRRSVNLIESLGRHFDVAVLAADDPMSGQEAWGAASKRFLRRRHSRVSLVADLAEGIMRGHPALLVRSTRAGLPAEFRSILEAQRPDLVVLGRPMFGHYLDAAIESGARVAIEADEGMPKAALSLARSDTAPVRQRLRALVEAITILGRMERSAYPRADQVWVASDKEKAAFAGFVREDHLVVVPNVIDIPSRRPDLAPLTAVAFLGWYPYPANEAAALELIRDVMPAVRAAGGPKRLMLIGPGPTRAMVDAARADGGVDILGEVPDVRVYLRAAGILLVPIRAGGGTRIKILEAIAAGVPVVSTALGMEGLDLRPEADLLPAEAAADFAHQVVRLAEDVDLRNRITLSAFDQVRARFSIEVLDAALDRSLAPLGFSR